MKKKWIFYLTIIISILIQHSLALAIPDSPLKIRYQDNQLIITNESHKTINVNQTNIRFRYYGKISKIVNIDDPGQIIDFYAQEENKNKAINKTYIVKMDGNKSLYLLPNQSLKLALMHDNKDVPHDLKVSMAPTPVNVTVNVSNSRWRTTLYICNTSGKDIPLKNIELNFNYSSPMPDKIWGSPWVGWKLLSQTNGRVVLTGGTEFTPALASDPNCLSPLTARFDAAPSLPLPTGPFVFKAEEGQGPVTTGNLNVILAPAPAAGLANPSLAITGPTARQNVTNWGTTWAIANIPTGTYTISGASITSDGRTFTADSKTATVTANSTTSTNITYKAQASTTTAVSINLITPPTAQVPITLRGNANTFNFTVASGSVINLPSDSYSVSSNIPGYTATPSPNPLVTPTNKTLSIAYSSVGTGGAGSRTINFVNQCPFPVWFGFISGATPRRGGGAGCASDADCNNGSVCVNRGAGGNQCFWRNPIPANNNFQLAANGGNNSVTIPYVQTPMNAVFSGAAAGRTNCTAAGCETADCGGGTGGCPPGRGFAQPTTQIEFTFQTNAPDYYNLSAVDGMNIPASMAPTAPFNPNEPYKCGTPGNPIATPLMGACTWNFTPPLVDYKWVRAGGNACTSNADCTGGTVCGLSKNAGTPRLRKTCGALLGYFNANRICAEQSNYGAPFNCQEQLPPPNQAYKMTNLLGCAPIPSCYQNGAGPNCCGCANWDKLGIPVPPAPFTEQCKNTNTFWNTRVQPGLEWVKRGCPSIYTYPFDDMSSTFTCRVNEVVNGVPTNSTDYTITFCPGGNTGNVKPIA